MVHHYTQKMAWNYWGFVKQSVECLCDRISDTKYIWATIIMKKLEERKKSCSDRFLKINTLFLNLDAQLLNLTVDLNYISACWTSSLKDIFLPLKSFKSLRGDCFQLLCYLIKIQSLCLDYNDRYIKNINYHRQPGFLKNPPEILSR